MSPRTMTQITPPFDPAPDVFVVRLSGAGTRPEAGSVCVFYDFPFRVIFFEGLMVEGGLV